MGFFDGYPYTNWHNVNLDWVLERVKEWGELVEANNQAFQDLEAANESFKEYVTNYLQDLDVQAAIDDKLDRMFESGVLGEYLQPYVSPVVTTWLEENITEPTGVVIDSSLTVAGACADAKAVGDRLKPLEYVKEDFFKTSLINCLQKMVFVDNTGEQLITDLKSAMELGEIFTFPGNSSIIHGRVQKTSSDNSIATLNTGATAAATLGATARNINTASVPFYNIYPLKQGNYNRLTVNAEYPENTTLLFGFIQLYLLNGTYYVRRLSGSSELNATVNLNVDDGSNFILVKFEGSGFVPDVGITEAVVKLTKE